AAALAGCGKSADADGLKDQERAAWRKQARDWLRADLGVCAKHLTPDTPQRRAEVRQAIQNWQFDLDLACVRDEGALAKFPEAERQAWRQFWADVGALLKKAQPQN